ncbi:MAG: type IV secretory system conjugative DNA transfer family protein [Elusimicrobiota bacterium]
MNKIKLMVRTAGYWLVAGIPYLMAKAFRGLARWKVSQNMEAFKRVPLLLLASLQGGGYALWAMDYTHFFFKPGAKAAGDPKLGPLGPAFWRHVGQAMDKGLHHLLWAPLLGTVSLFWAWFAVFGPVCLGLTLWFLSQDSEGQVNPEKIGKLDVSPEKVKALAKKGVKEGTFLGASKSQRGRAVSLKESWRTSHAYCVGASRSGKTASVMLPLALQDIANGHPVIFFDGKGDIETRNALLDQAYKTRNIDDFLVFSMSDIGRSYSYNPLQFGTATQKKDKLIGAFTWTEEHYKKVAEDTLLTILLGLEGTGRRYNLEDVYLCLTEQDAVQHVYEQCQDRKAKVHLDYYYRNFKTTTKDITGLIKDLGLIIKSDVWPLMNTYAPEIDLLDVIMRKKMVYFVFNTQAYPETAERLAKIILQDLRAVSDHIQNKIPREERVFTPIYVDEFNCFAFDAFGDFMSKCGGAGFALTLAHQSLGQLVKRGDGFKEEILDNANIKIILRQDSPDTIDEFARMIGTHDRTEYTAQIQDGLLTGKTDTGMGSRRLVETFNIGPNVIRQLQPYQAAFLIKQPFLYDVVQMGVYDRVELTPNEIDTILPVKSHSADGSWGDGIDLRNHQRELNSKGLWS